MPDEALINQAFSIDHFRSHGHQLIDLIADYLSDAMHNDDGVTIPWQPPQEQLEFWKEDFRSAPLDSPLALFRNVLQRSVHLHSPRYMGHQTATTLPASILSSLVVDVLNNGMGVYEMGMSGNAMERIITGHLAGKMGLGNNASGFVTSGGSLGNLTALLAIRAIAAQSANEQYCIFASQECHYSVDRAIRMLGGNIELVKVPVDSSYKIRPDLLQEYYSREIATGKKALCVIGSACSTATGSYDDLEALSKFCISHKIWFHVDAAHGGAAIFSPKYKGLLNGIEHADSVIVDFHKMMLTPSLSTAV
ncbi:MAG TPA: aminotransferase class I/II-fold pyridoxal phosphate-dependent enzyme, partial [Chitinophagaceae bacterium]|nr:aminotransferase class I/II-fold pyridoxal phosphate-dependent enzyme [Chitinophagaceae bacterium]